MRAELQARGVCEEARPNSCKILPVGKEGGVFDYSRAMRLYLSAESVHWTVFRADDNRSHDSEPSIRATCLTLTEHLILCTFQTKQEKDIIVSFSSD